MASYLSEYAHLLLRWLHVLTAMAWVGQSLYLLMLEARLQRDGTQGATGDIWTAHDGHLFQGALRSPGGTPPPRIGHWLFPAAYTAWLSGFLLLCVLYLRHPSVYLVHANSTWSWVAALAGWQASVLAFVWLVLGWTAYDRLCLRLSAEQARPWTEALATALLAILAAWLASRLFPGRAAFLLTGALLATWMTANLAHWVIPAQRRQLAARRAGLPVDPHEARHQRQRAAHNTCLALPVVFLMLAPHHAALYNSPHTGVTIVLVIATGTALQQYWLRRHSGRSPLRYLGAAIALIILLGWQTAPDHAPLPASPDEVQVTDKHAILPIVQARCIQCHASRPGPYGLVAAGGLRLETEQDLARHQTAIRASVGNRRMPPANLTDMTEAERDTLTRWLP